MQFLYIHLSPIALHIIELYFIDRFSKVRVPPNHPVVMDDYDILKPMMTRGSPLCLKNPPIIDHCYGDPAFYYHCYYEYHIIINIIIIMIYYGTLVLYISYIYHIYIYYIWSKAPAWNSSVACCPPGELGVCEFQPGTPGTNATVPGWGFSGGNQDLPCGNLENPRSQWRFIAF